LKYLKRFDENKEIDRRDDYFIKDNISYNRLDELELLQYFFEIAYKEGNEAFDFAIHDRIFKH